MRTEAEPPRRVRTGGANRGRTRGHSLDGTGTRVASRGSRPAGGARPETGVGWGSRGVKRPVPQARSAPHAPNVRLNSPFGSRSAPATRPAQSFTPSGRSGTSASAVRSCARLDLTPVLPGHGLEGARLLRLTR